MRTCRSCHEPLVVAATGRPPVWCTPCQRTAEAERRRLDRRLERLEWRLVELATQADVAAAGFPPGGGMPLLTAERAAVTRRIEEARQQQRAMFAAEESSHQEVQER